MAHELSVDQWSEFEQFVSSLRATLETKRKALAEWLGRMSHTQLARAKKLLRFLCNADAVERLAMVGRGELALDQSLLPIPARLWRGLPESVRKDLQPGREAELLTPRGVVIKQLHRMNVLELEQVLDPRAGLLPAHKQRPLHPAGSTGKGRPAAADDEAEAFESLQLLEKDCALIVGKEGSRIRVPLKTLRAVLK